MKAPSICCANKKSFIDTLKSINDILKGWGNQYFYCNEIENIDGTFYTNISVLDVNGHKTSLGKTFEKNLLSLLTSTAFQSMSISKRAQTDKDFMELVEFLSEAGLDAIGVFGYSDEDKTEAVDLSDKVDPELIKERVNELSSLADELITNRAESRVGQKVSVLIEDAQEQEGRAEHQGPEVDGSTFIQSGRKFKVGEYVDAVISENNGADLVAIPI